MRRMVREVRLAPADLVYPIFVTRDQAGPIEGMPGVSRLTVEGAVKTAREAAVAGLMCPSFWHPTIQR